jgi:hypothetical protein
MPFVMGVIATVTDILRKFDISAFIRQADSALERTGQIIGGPLPSPVAANGPITDGPAAWVPVEAVRVACSNQAWLSGTTPPVVGTPHNAAVALMNAATLLQVAEGRNPHQVAAELTACGVPESSANAMVYQVAQVWAQAKQKMGSGPALAYARSDLTARRQAFAGLKLTRRPAALAPTAGAGRYTCARCGQAVPSVTITSNPDTGEYEEVCPACLSNL